MSVVDFSKAKSLEIIGDSAFRDIPITEITFPENLKTIGTYAFYNDTSLNKADFSKAKKLETIGEFAFGTCKNMTDINLEEATALKTIGYGAFNSIGTDSIVIPDSVETIYETQMQTFSNYGVYGFTIYGKAGSVAEEYANNSNGRVTFYNLDGVYLEKPKEATYVEVADGTYQVETIWPKNPKDAGVIWKSSDKSIATVDGNGLVTRAEKGNGIVTITAIRGEFSDSIDLKISTPAKTSADGKWKYRVLADNTVALCGYTGGTDKKVTMPDSIDGRTVTRLQAFYMRKWDNVKQLILPKTVTKIEANALEEYQQEIIIPEGNVISYIGDNAFGWAKVYGPEDFAFKGYLEYYGGYYLDKKIYMSGYGPIKWYEGSAEKQGYVMNILHIPSSLPENTQVEWSSSRPDMVNIKDGSDGETRIIGPYNNEYGKVTVTVSAGEYQESREFEFENQPEKLEDGDYTYSVIDENQKTAALVSYKGTCTDEAPIKVPEKINGYTITTIKNHAYNNVSGNRKIVYVIPDTVTEIEQYALLGDAVVVGTEGTEAERFVKRYGNQLIFCDRNKMVLNTSKTEITKDTSTSENESITETELYVAYAPEDAGKITWTSNNETVATVLDGRVQAHKAGIAVITATCGEFSASCVVEVSYTNNGFKYKELADGTVEITGCDNNLSKYNYKIPSTIAGKNVTVLGEGPIWTDQKVIIPDTVTTIKKAAIESDSWRNVIEVSMPASVTKIEDGAFVDSGMGYEIYGSADSKAKSYAEKYDYIDFYEDGIVLAGDFYEDDGCGVGDIAVGEQMEVEIVHMPMDVDDSNKITWTSSDPKSVSVTADSDNPKNAVIEALAVTNKRVEISCKVGDYETVVLIEVYTEAGSGEYTYTTNLDGTINIVSYEGDEKTVSIPSKLDKKTVVSVAGFEGNDTIEKVTIPSTVTAIQYNTFYNCMNLSTVTFASGSKLKYIGDTAFAGTGVASITMPNTVAEMGNAVFYQCSNLSTVTLSNKLEGIENASFSGCVKLNKITIPTSVTYIGENAFLGSGLTTISIPKNVESIGDRAFKNCTNLKTATIANQKAYVGEDAFENCGITLLSVSQTEVGRSSYANNNDLKTLTLKEGVTTLEYRSFYRCENLENITFPKSLEKIGAASFDETKWMEKQPDGPVYVNSILINYKGDPENVAIADGTKYIESIAFDAKKNLTSVVIADSVTTIRTAAFVNCSKLERIVIPNTVTTIEKQAMGYSGMYAEGSEGIWNATPNYNLVIAGTKGSAAEKYAKENGFTFEAIIPMTGIELDKVTDTLNKGEEVQLTATCKPEDTTEASHISWASSNDNVATVDQDGKVTAVGVGTANITASAGGYTATCKITVNAKLTDEMVTLERTSVEYNGKAQKPAVTVKDGDNVLKEGTNYTVTYKNNTDAGKATVTVTGAGNGNYAGTVTKTFDITKKTITDAMVTLESDSMGYTGQKLEPKVTVKDGDLVFTKDKDYTVTYAKNVNVGTATVTIEGTGNCTGEITKHFKITEKQLTASMVTLKATSETYTGKEIKPEVEVKDGTTALVEGKDYEVTYTENVNVGTATVTINGIGSYGGQVEKTFKITAKKLDASQVNLKENQLTYSGNALKPEVEVKDGETVLAADKDYSVTYASNTNAGTATVTITGTGNYQGIVEKSFTIKAKALTEEMAALETDSAEYTGKAITPKVTVNDGDKLLKENTDYTVIYEENVNVGTAIVTVSGKGNYAANIQKKFVITAKKLDESMVTLKKTRFANTGKEIKPEVVVKDGTVVLTEGKDYELSYKDNVKTGTATATVIGKGNYKANVDKTFEIVDAIEITDAMVTLEKTTYTYTGKALTPKVTVKDGDTTLKQNTDYKVTYKENKNVGTATVTVEGVEFYAGMVEKTFTIMPKVSYRTQVQSYGWEKKYAANGAISGTIGKAKRLETIQIKAEGDADLGITYRTHVQSYGWQKWTSNGVMNGTVGKAKRLEAIQIKLTGDDAEKYSVYYRVHAQSYGWLNWAKDGEYAGTAGLAKRLEAIQIVIVAKDKTPGNVGGIASVSKLAYVHNTHSWDAGKVLKEPTCTAKGQKEQTCKECGTKRKVDIAATGHKWDEGKITKEPASYTEDGVKTYTCKVCGATKNTSYAKPYPVDVTYKTQVQSYGWMNSVKNGALGGTIGKAKRMETMSISVKNPTDENIDLGIAYNAHVQSYGWQGKTNDVSTWKKDGQNAGTVGKAKRLEAIQIQLTGKDAEKYDVYYRVHAQSYGWLGWAKNGEISGTAGYAKRLEAIQIIVVEKDAKINANLGGIKSATTRTYVVK